jgi:folate-dependent phosphoribosylglycinamide formyltransferase PurN
VHLATLEMDAGPILAQEVVPVLPGDTEETLHERIKVVERTLYPATVAWALAELEAGRDIQPERDIRDNTVTTEGTREGAVREMTL